jgi:hypothetical protein
MVQPAAGLGLRPDMLGRFMAEQLRVGARFGVDQFAPSSWMSNISVAPGGMTPPAP